MTKKGLFVAATGQHIGKTTLCLGFLAALRERYQSVGFLKPIGQQHVEISDTLKVDKDVVLFKEHFKLSSDYHIMNPVLCPTGFTRDYLDNKVDREKLAQRIVDAYAVLSEENDFVLVEGTGHIGVGSLFELNNAQVAKMLGLDVVLIVKGGLGSAFDSLALNVEMCHRHGVAVRGIILNKVLSEKEEMLFDYFPKALKRWNIPLLGCVPFNQLLNTPSMKDFELLFDTVLITGHEYRYRHFADARLVADSLESYLEEMDPEQLIITPACREDIIMGTVEHHLRAKLMKKPAFEGGIILTGQNPPRQELLKYIQKVDIPILYTPLGSFSVMKMITSHTAKIQREDTRKVDQAIELVENNIARSLFLPKMQQEVPASEPLSL